MIYSKCVPLEVALKCVIGQRVEYIFSKCLNLRMVEEETNTANRIVKKVKEKMVENWMDHHTLRNPMDMTPGEH